MPEISPKVFRDLLKTAHLPGGQFAGIDPDGKPWHYAVGVADVSKNAPITPRTRFEAASLSKPVFAYLIYILIERGELAADFLDQPLHVILPTYVPLAGAESQRLDQNTEGRAVTPRLVLSHRTGLPNWVRSEEKLEHSFKPGEGFDYSGEGYRYLQQVIEKLKGTSLEELAKKYVFDELGMTDSSFVRSPGDNVAIGHDAMLKPRAGPPIVSGNAAGSLHTTASDYVLFLKACLNNKNFQKAFGNPTVLMTKDQKAATSTAKDKLNSIAWSLGWGLQNTDGEWAIAFHWGDGAYSKAFTAINFRTGAAVVYFANSEHGLAIAYHVMNLSPSIGSTSTALDYLFDKYGFERYTPDMEKRHLLTTAGEEAEAKGDYRTARKRFREALDLYPKNQLLQRRVKWVDDLLQIQISPVRLKTETLRAYVGHYGPVQISFDADSHQLRLAVGGQIYNLVPLSANRFAAEKDTTSQFEFILNSEGKPVKLVHSFLNGGEAVSVRRTIDEKEHRTLQSQRLTLSSQTAAVGFFKTPTLKRQSSSTELLHEAMPRLGAWYNFGEDGFALQCVDENEAQRLKTMLTKIFSTEISSKSIAIDFQKTASGMVFVMLKIESVNKLDELIKLHKDDLALLEGATQVFQKLRQ